MYLINSDKKMIFFLKSKFQISYLSFEKNNSMALYLLSK